MQTLDSLCRSVPLKLKYKMFMFMFMFMFMIMFICLCLYINSETVSLDPTALALVTSGQKKATLQGEFLITMFSNRSYMSIVWSVFISMDMWSLFGPWAQCVIVHYFQGYSFTIIHTMLRLSQIIFCLFQRLFQTIQRAIQIISSLFQRLFQTRQEVCAGRRAWM